MQSNKSTRRRWAVTLLELLVVVLIIGILSTIATGVYSGETNRARVAATHDLIRQLEIAVTRYEVDLGSLPPSGSGTSIPPTTSRQDGSGYLHLVLVHSMSGSALTPASKLWRGPYINLTSRNLDANATDASDSNVIDAWGLPVLYVESSYYATSTSSFLGGTEVFSGSAPTGASTDLPAPNPFYSRGETFYNPSTFQIISFGPDGRTLSTPYHGAAADDINNFGY